MKRGNGQSYERTVFTNFRSKDILLKGIDEISTLLRFLYMDESHSIVINNGLCDLRIRMTASMDILAQNLQFPSCPEMHSVSLSVYANGEIRKWENHEHPLAKLRVVLKEGNTEKHGDWPFECDGECRALLDDNKVIALLNYMRYI